MQVSRDLAAGATVGVEMGLPVASALKSDTVLAARLMARTAIQNGTKAWIEQSTGPDGLLPANVERQTTEGPCAGGGGAGEARHDTCLCSLTRVTPLLVLVREGVGGADG